MGCMPPFGVSGITRVFSGRFAQSFDCHSFDQFDTCSEKCVRYSDKHVTCDVIVKVMSSEKCVPWRSDASNLRSSLFLLMV